IVAPAALMADRLHGTFKGLKAFVNALTKSAVPEMLVSLCKLLVRPSQIRFAEKFHRRIHHCLVKKCGINPNKTALLKLVPNSMLLETRAHLLHCAPDHAHSIKINISIRLNKTHHALEYDLDNVETTLHVSLLQKKIPHVPLSSSGVA